MNRTRRDEWVLLLIAAVSIAGAVALFVIGWSRL